MRLLRFRDGSTTRTGLLTDGRITVGCDERWSWGDGHEPEPGPALAEVELTAPIQPVTVFGMAHNTGPQDRRLPPRAFLKAAASIADPGGEIPLPAGIGRVDVEAELAVVIGRPVHDADPATALQAVLGYTVGLDVTARDAQQADPRWTEAKSRTGFTPIGPWIETELAPDRLGIALTVSGRPAVLGTTAELARPVAELLAYLSSLVELRPGDIVLTGAPGTYAPVAPGDTVRATIDGIGTLEASVVAHRPPVPHPSNTRTL